MTTKETQKVNKGFMGGLMKTKQPWWEPVLIVFLALYPMRHIHWGIDWWDTGYNYANFEYAGLDHMDPMWFFSTYLANVVGHFMTLLPGGDALVGMNLYTGLLVSVLAVMGYLFCTRKLGIPRIITFVGEFVAISLCWCPTALLYNYLTYILFLACVILLYMGLTGDKKWLLFAAGVCLGTNVLVRFSNLPEAAMIVAVWAYAFLVWLENRKGKFGEGRLEKGVSKATAAGNVASRVGGFPMAVRYTLWCLGGYLAALVVLLGYVFIKYGADTYVNSIMRLFAMTENATDYKATSMLDGMVSSYVENLYWMLRMGVFVVVGTVGFVALKLVIKLVKHVLKRGFQKECAWANNENIGRDGAPVVVRALWDVAYICACGLAAVMLAWLYLKEFCTPEFYAYNSMWWPGVTFLMLTLGIAFIRVVHPRCPLDEKLISGMLILVVLLTSLGSNNKVYPSMNNLFVAAPYTLWQCWRFVRNVKDWKVISPFPAKAALVAFMGLFLFQISGFGMGFVFGEATGLRNVTAVIENNDVLTGVKMSPERAEIMTEITDYVEEQGLKGHEVITYGKIPSICYYLEMPPAFNSWSDLDSFQYSAMESAMQELAEEIESGESECPVIILNNADLTYEESPKFGLIKGFMDEYNYDLTFENEKFVLYQAR